MEHVEGAGAVHIRPAEPRDDDALARFFAAYHDEFRYELGDQDVAGEGRRARTYYANGAILVAEGEGGPIGCVAYEPWGTGRARMKRMYVPPHGRGQGVGKRLATAIVERARADGYREMVLDTTDAMAAATGIYRALGFREFEPDYVAPCRGTVYYRLRL